MRPLRSDTSLGVPALLLIAGGALSCGKSTSGGPSPRIDEGRYFRTGASVSFKDHSLWGPLSYFSATNVGANVATITRRGEGYHLELSDCPNGLPLRPVDNTGRVWLSDGVDCELDDVVKLLGYTSRTYRALRVDFPRRALEYRACFSLVDETVGCGQVTGVFSPMGDAPEGAGGAGGSDGTSELVNFADSVRAWKLDNERSGSLACAELGPSGIDCAEGTQGVSHKGRYGTLHEMEDGRFYLGGYDCYLPSDTYEGEPIRCGDSFEGLVDVGIPTAFIYKFSFDGYALHFVAEMHAQESTYWYILDGVVTPL